MIKEALLAGNFDGLVDQNLGTTYDHEEMDRMVTCAATCVRIMPEERPTMRQVILQFCSIPSLSYIFQIRVIL